MSTAQQIMEVASKAMKDRLLDYLLTHHEALERTQVNIMRALGTSQATLAKHLAEFKGQGLILERAFGTAVVYDVQYSAVINQGMAKRYERFDLNQFLGAHGLQSQDWSGKVFVFGDMVYIFANHTSGFNIGIPMYGKERRERVEALTLGLNIEALIVNIIRALNA